MRFIHWSDQIDFFLRFFHPFSTNNWLPAASCLIFLQFQSCSSQVFDVPKSIAETWLEQLEGLCWVFRRIPTTDSDLIWPSVPNHAHFLFRTGVSPLATIMRRLLTGYAVSFNRRHKRRGQLFPREGPSTGGREPEENRYKSIVCQEDAYLKELVRYIHLNPVRTGIVENLKGLNRYPYCGHSSVMGRKKRPWQDVDYVLGYFGKTAKSAREAYFEYVSAGIGQGRLDELTGGGLVGLGRPR